MLDNVRRKRSQISIDLYKSVLLRHFEFSLKVLELNLGKLRLGEKRGRSFRYFGQGYYFSSEECRTKNVEFKMLECPAGAFIMGDGGYGTDPEIIEVAFLLGETEVTQKLYQAVMGTNPSKFLNEDKPVEQVSWVDAILFCNALSRLQGLDECYSENPESLDFGWDCDFSRNGYRLPTEKEWEYAAKAGTNNRWAGTDADSYSEINKYCVWQNNSVIPGTPDRQTSIVASKLPNEWGFYDMSGNVSEWCWDKKDAEDAFEYGANRIYRGGNFNFQKSALKIVVRDHGDSPTETDKTIGFRICRTLI